MSVAQPVDYRRKRKTVGTQGKNRPGGVVTVGTAGRFTLVSQAAPSGWWGVPAAGGRPVRLLVSGGVWRVAAAQ